MSKKFYFLVLFAALTGDAFAYLDPGTGSVFLQAILASVLAGGVFFRNIKAWIMNFFYKKKNEDPKKDNE